MDTRITIPDTGVVLDLPEPDYRSHYAYGSTDLKMARRSVAHLTARRAAPEVETPAKRAGKILHSCILERDTFEDRYCILPENAPKDLRCHRNAAKPSEATLASIAFWDQWEADNFGKSTIGAKEFDDFRWIADCIRLHPELRPYFELAQNAASEVSCFAVDPETGIALKCRKDYRGNLGGVNFTLDMKSTEDARDEAFVRSAVIYDYFAQDALYTDVGNAAGDPVDTFIFVAFEKPDYPQGFRPDNFPIQVYEVEEHDVAWGREHYREALALLKHSLETGESPGYDTSIKVLRRPAWAK